MKYILNVNINSDGDFSYDSEWIKVKGDCIDNIWLFDTSKEYLIRNIKYKMVNFEPFLNLIFKKTETLHLELYNGNQELHFTLATYNEETKEMNYFEHMYVDVNAYDWESIEQLCDF